MLGNVDLLAGEERRDPVRQARRFGSVEQRVERRIVDPLLRDVDAPVVPVERQRLRALRIAGEELVERRCRKPPCVVGEIVELRAGRAAERRR